MNLKRVPNKPIKKLRPFGLSKADSQKALRIAKEEKILPEEALGYMRQHRLKSKHECPDY